MNVSVNGWNLFPSPPNSIDSDDPGARMKEMLSDAREQHDTHFQTPVDAFGSRNPRDVEAATASPVPVINANPQQSFPRTVAVSLVLLVVAGTGTLVTTVLNALINKSIMDKGDRT